MGKVLVLYDSATGNTAKMVAFYVDHRCDQHPLAKPEAGMGAN